MNAPVIRSSKLQELLTALWESPIFGTSYPLTVKHAHTNMLQAIDQLYQQCVTTLDQVLALAWPEACPAERDVVIRQVAAKSVAFCGAVAVEQLQDVERLRAAAITIALVSWIDQTMDRGDEAMVRAVELVAGQRKQASDVSCQAVQRYVAALGWFQRGVAVLARPEDAQLVLRCLLNDTLLREARMWRLSQHYQRMDANRFWNRFANEIGRLSVHNVGFVAVTAMIYAIYRHQQPQLPCLRAVLHNASVMNGPIRAGNATIRMLDDIGDRAIDMGTDPAWGMFAINLWNQPDRRHVSAFLHVSGVEHPPTRTAMTAALVQQDEQTLITLWLNYVREAYAALLPEQSQPFTTFLRLSRRVVEAGLVNALGDDILAEEPRELALGA
jgi:hypothetical protein